MSARPATRTPMRTTPSDRPRTMSADRAEIVRLLEQLAVPSCEGHETSKVDTWSQWGLWAGDARYVREHADGTHRWWSCTVQGCKSLAEVEQHILAALTRMAGVV